MLAPLLMVEILSSFTESFDRVDKFSDYRILTRYLLVHQIRMEIECFRCTQQFFHVRTALVILGDSYFLDGNRMFSLHPAVFSRAHRLAAARTLRLF